jgi:predicted HTH transcriptional regulator
MAIEQLLRQPEGKTLELKRDLSSPQPVLRTLVAFANSAGGKLILGVEDPTRYVVGVEDPLDLEKRLANLVADTIAPRLLPVIEMVPWRSTHLIVVEVFPSPLRPHYLKALGPERGTYVRLGSTNRQADAALIAELRRGTGLESYDEQPLPDLDSEALDFVAASECFSQVRRLRRQDLLSLGLVTKHQGRVVPTIGGVILFGRDRLARVPDAWIQAGCFAGKDRATLADRAELREYPVRAIESAVRFVERNTRTGAEIGRLKRRDVPTVPPAALREALVNAVVHADYSQRGAPIRIAIFDERIEVENPGILLPGLTVEDLREGVSRLRNPVLGRVFKELGLVEQWGSGIQRMTGACVGAGLPAPEFTELALRFRVTLWTVPVAAPATDALDDQILDFLETPAGRSTAEIAAHIGLTTRATQHRLARLVDRTLVLAVGSGPRDPRRRWFLVHRTGVEP